MIGVFDSGLGGLSVLPHLRAVRPAEDMLYLADHAFCPYGPRPPAEIQARSQAATGWLLGQGARAIVVACNTATVHAIASLRARWPAVPFVGVEPAVKPAAAATRSGTVGVLATAATAAGERLEHLISTHARELRVLTRPCPGWVEQVERGALDTAETRVLVAAQVASLVEAGADVLVLGCTHYPFLRPVIQAVAGPGVVLIDTGAAVARRLDDVLESGAGTGSETGSSLDPTPGALRFVTTGDATAATAVATRLLGSGVAFAALEL